MNYRRLLRSFSIAAAVAAFPVVTFAAYGDTSHFVGRIYAGDGGPAVSAWLDFADDVAYDGSGNAYVADTYDNVIRKIRTDGTITTLAGSGAYGDVNGAKADAKFALPRGVAVDNQGTVYVADTGNSKVKKVTSGGTVSTLVSSGLKNPEDVVVVGSRVYILDTGNNAIKSVLRSGGSVTTLTASGLNAPTKFDANAAGTTLYVADRGSNRVRSVSTTSGAVSTLVGSGTFGYREGTGTSAQFENVTGVAVDGNTLFVSDHNGAVIDRIRKVNLSTRATSLLRQDTKQKIMIFPAGMDVWDGRVVVAMSGLGTIHSFAVNDGTDDQLEAGVERFGNRNGSRDRALFGRPYDLVVSPNGQFLYVADNNKIRKVRLSDGQTSHVIGSSVDNYREGTDFGTLPMRFSTAQGITVNSTGTRLYVADRWNNRIRGVNLTADPVNSYLISGAGLINTNGSQDNGYRDGVRCSKDVQHTGQAGCAYFRNPTGIAISPDDTFLYVADTGNNRIRKVRISDGETFLVAGSGEAGFADGTGSSAKFNRPFGISLDSRGKTLYVADSANQRIRAIDLTTNRVWTIAGNGLHGYRDAIGTDAVFAFPEYVKVGPDGKLYVSEAGHRIRLVDPQTGDTRLVAGSGVRGYVNGSRTATQFNNPKGIAVGPNGTALYVADSWNDRIRRVDIGGTAPYSDPAPRVDSVEPREVNPTWDDGTGLRVAVKGANFRYRALVRFGELDAERTWVGTAQVVAQLPLSQMSPGWYDVSVINVDGQRSILSAGFGLQDSANGRVPDRFFRATGETEGSVPSVAPGSGFFAFPEDVRGGFHITSGNVRGDATPEIIASGGDGLAPQVRVFSPDGTLRGQFFAYDAGLRTGVRIAACDVNNDGRDEIVTVPGPGAIPHVRFFDVAGNTVGGAGFFALDGRFRGGAFLACGDVNGDDRDDIVVTAGRGGGAQVVVYKPDGTPIANFFAYNQFTFHGGIRVAAVDIDDDGRDEIITGPEYGAPHIQMFKIRPREIRQLNPGIYAFNEFYQGGVDVAGADINGDGTEEIMVSVGLNAQSYVKVYDKTFTVLHRTFFAYDEAFTGGVHVSSADVDRDGIDEILTIPRSGGGANLRIIE